MGVETVTTITCDECGADITDAAQAQVTVQVQTSTPPEVDEDGLTVRGSSFPVMTSQTVTLCETHAAPAITKLNKIVPPPE